MNIKHLAIGGILALTVVSACGSDEDDTPGNSDTNTVLTTPDTGASGGSDTTVMGSTGTSGG